MSNYKTIVIENKSYWLVPQERLQPDPREIVGEDLIESMQNKVMALYGFRNRFEEMAEYMGILKDDLENGLEDLRLLLRNKK